MAITSFDELVAKVKSGKKPTVALVCANDAHALEAVIHAKDLVNSILVVEGDKVDELNGILTSLGQDPADFEIEIVPEGMHPSVCAAQLIHAGRANFLMKGKIMTGNLLKGVLAPEAELRTGSLMSHVMLFEVPGYHKLLCVTDGGMCTYPDLEKKAGIVRNAVDFFHKIGIEKPNVAALCAIETINPKMQETVDAAELKRMSLEGELEGCYVEGPISYDLAMVPELSAVKGYTACPCCGDFDILLVPEIVVGNVLGKCLTYTCGGRMAGLIMGCKVPIVLTSRGSSAEEKYYSLAMGAGFVS
ncbi:MAG: phosphate butyryltransferase [Christensenellaceae bacterium]|nr:phosphate butyryltransferase [Christensenellaceae bacterium]